MNIPLINPEAIEFDGILKKVELMRVRQGDILLLRFNALMPITADVIQSYSMKLFQAAKGRISVIPMPLGMTVERVEAVIREQIMKEIADQAKAAMVEAGIDPETGLQEIKKRMEGAKPDAGA